jgi:secreted PhoX family phosphatase
MQDPSHINDVIATRVSRRTVLGGGMAAAAAFLVGVDPLGARAAGALTAGKDPAASAASAKLGFTAVPMSTADAVAVPAGYTATPFVPWGTPILGSYPAFSPGTKGWTVNEGNTAAQQGEQTGSDHDGMWYFPIDKGPKGNEHGLLVMNHEAVDEGYLHSGTFQPSAWLTNNKALWTLEMVRKSQNAHGVSVIEIRKNANGAWGVVRSPRNRRITVNTPMAFSGAAAGHRLLRTAADPAGRTPIGTFNNCANGYTPWGTYLTCEENFNGYFRLDDANNYEPEAKALNARYGVGGDRNAWATKDPRFVVTPANPNEPNRHGWVVEIDPFDPRSTPVKRTALGRFKHEGASIHVGKGQRVVAYMGDDQANEFVYKFVSADNYKSMLARGKSPLAEGTLYVAKFNDDGSGQWLPLVQGTGPLTAANGFSDQGDVLIKARLAASAVGATPMDRPEWTTVDPTTGAVYVTCTNNTSRTVATKPNPRTPNKWGHIIRWNEAGNDHTALAFTWDVFLLAGPGRDATAPDGSNILAEDAFGSPDGIWADSEGRIWIQTDGSQPTGANNQMLVADPAVKDRAGHPELRRFLTGSKGCEITGITTTPDQRTMFVNVQHPGENGGATWPHTHTLPRSATVVITKDDGGVIGS